MDFQTYLDALLQLAPVFSAATCILFVGFSRRDCLTFEERRLKNIVIMYLLLNILVWFTVFCYSFFPETFAYLNSICFAVIILSPIFFYRILRLLTRMRREEDFSSFHYLIPIGMGGVLLIWSFFIPLDLREIVNGKFVMRSKDYAFYSRFSATVIPIIRMAFIAVYFTLFTQQLVRYYRWAQNAKNLVRLPVRWVIFLIILSLFPVYFSVLALLQPRDRIFAGIWGVVAALGVFVQFILLTYHIIRRKYLLYTKIYNETIPDNGEVAIDQSGRRTFSGQLTRERLEEWFRNEKPYLKADFKITDVMKEMDVNRTVVSSFINQTYGMNFNRYVNQWRLKEFERLSLLYGDENKNVPKLYAQAGFGELRQYRRAAAAEQKANEK